MTFPDHELVSAKIFKDNFLKNDNDSIIHELILKDLELHKIKSIDVDSFCQNHNPKIVINLLISAWASYNSNLELFGGENSDSSKIKKKHFEARGKKICKIIFKT